MPRIELFDETYYEPVYDTDAMGNRYISMHKAVAGRVNLEKATANTAIDWALRCSVVLFWGGLDLLLQAIFLAYALQAYLRTGQVMESRHAHWSRIGGCLILPIAAVITLGAFYLIHSVSRTPPVLQGETKSNLVAFFEAGRVYHGTWEGHPQAGALGMRIVSLDKEERHCAREFKAVLFDVAQPEKTRSYNGVVMFLESAGEYPVILTPETRARQVEPGPDMSIYLGNERFAELFLKAGPAGTLIADGKVPLVFRPVEKIPQEK